MHPQALQALHGIIFLPSVSIWVTSISAASGLASSPRRIALIAVSVLPFRGLPFKISTFIVSPPLCSHRLLSYHVSASFDRSRRIVYDLTMSNLIRQTTQLALHLVRPYVTPESAVIDATCGSGRDTLALAEMGPARLYAFDVQEQAVRAIRASSGPRLLQKHRRRLDHNLLCAP